MRSNKAHRLVALLLAGILLVMGAYRLFSWLCSRGAGGGRRGAGGGRGGVFPAL